MKCPYCQTGFNFDGAAFESTDAYSHTLTVSGYNILYGDCPECEKTIIILETKDMDADFAIGSSKILYPRLSTRFVEPEVPERIREDFVEAAAILGLSPKASAALSRRLLQHILRDKFGLNRPNLAQEIDDFLKMKDVPSYLSGAVDAVRNVGNFAAHPLKDTNTGEIVDVEPGEAEWLLDVLESLLDFAYVQPERLKQKQNALNLKLKNLGKPPMK